MATYDDLAETWNSIKSPIGRYPLNIDIIKSILENNFNAFQINTNALTAVDLRINKYLYVDKRIEQVSGYSRDDYLKKGPRFMFSKIPLPHKIGVITSTIHQNKYISSLAEEEIRDLIFNREYNIIDKEKKSRRVLHQVIDYIIDPEKNMLAVVSLQTLIGNISKATKFNYYILSKSKNKIIYPEARRSIKPIFTDREREIIEFISKGYSSRQIADQLFLSLHTIKTHRKNILRKSKASNFFELLASLKN